MPARRSLLPAWLTANSRRRKIARRRAEIALSVERLEARELMAAENLLQNGSFEEDVVTATQKWDVFSSIAGWQLVTGPKFEIQRNLGVTASDGSQYLELDADVNGPTGSSPSGEQGSIRIAQSVAVDAGATLQLQFDFAGRKGYTQIDNQLEYRVLDAAGTVLTSGTLLKNNSNWTTHSVSFVAPEGEEGEEGSSPATTEITIEFADVGANNTFGTFLDNVRLYDLSESTPETPSVRIDVVGNGIAYEGTTPHALLTLTRTGSTEQALTVYYTLSGQADEDDFTLGSPNPSVGRATFAAGSATTTLEVRAVSDQTGEGDELLSFTVVSGSGYVAEEGNASANITIVEDKPRKTAYGPCQTCQQDYILAFVFDSQGKLLADYGVAGGVVNFQSTSNPHPILEADVRLPYKAGVLGIEVQARIDVGPGRDLVAPTAYFTTTGAPGEIVRLGVMVDTSSLESGSYRYVLDVTYRYAGGDTVVQTIEDTVEVENRTGGAEGNRWKAGGTSQLATRDDGKPTLIGARGSKHVFEEGTDGKFRSREDATFSELVKNPDGSVTRVDKWGTESRYDVDGRLQWERDSNGRVTEYYYTDGNGDGIQDELDLVVDPFGRTVDYVYSAGRLASIVDAEGRTSFFSYDGDLLTAIQAPDPDGAGPLSAGLTTFAYDAYTKLMTSTTNALGETTNFTYDALGRLESITSPNCGCFNTTSFMTTGDSNGVAYPDEGIGTALSPVAVGSGALRVTTRTDEQGNVTQETYDRSGRIVKTVDATGYVTTYERNRDGDVTKITQGDPDGTGPLGTLVTQFSYDAQGNLTRSIAPNGATETWTYDATWNKPTSYVDAVGRKTFFTLDGANGNLLSVRQVLGADDATSTETNDVVTSFTYTDGTGGVPAGLVQTVTDPRGFVSRYEYDARGRIVQAIYAEGTSDEATESFEYDAADNLTAFVDGLGRRSESTYDAVGNLVGITLPDPDGAGGQLAPTMQFTYDLLNRQTSATDPLGRTTDVVYERFGRTIKTIAPDHDGDGERSESVVLLNALGLAVSATDPLGRTTTYAYDSLHRVSQITSPDPDGAGPLTASTQTLAYDRLGRIVGATDALGRTTSYRYDRVGNLVEIVAPDADPSDALPAPKTTFTYNAVNELTSVTDALGRRTTYSYDTLGRLTRVTLPDPDGTGPISASAVNYVYDAAGNLIRETDPLGRATNYEYDARNRLTRVTQADPDGSGPLTSPVTTYAYDDANQVTSTTDPLGRTISYTYDGLGRLVTLTQPDPDGAGPQAAPVWSYEYDAAGKLTRRIDPLGNATTYGYDAHDNLVSVLLADPDGAGPQVAPLTTYAYDDAGQLLSTTDPLGRTTSYAYDHLGRVTSLTQADPDGAGPQTAPVWNYAYDAVGNLTTQTDPLGRVTTYGYDRLDRLVSLTRPDPDGTGGQAAPQMLWSYDNVGQLTSNTDPLGNVTHFAYDAMGRTTSVTDALGGVTAYAYDKNSNLTRVTDALGRNTVFAYDALNRNTQITQPDPDGAGSLTSPATKYKYDAAGQLVEVVNPLNRSTKYQYDNLGRLTKETDALNQSNTYTYDAVGNLLSAADPLGRTTQFQYDNLYRRTASIDALGGTTGFTYDTASNLIALTDPVGNVTSWTFDGLNRVTAETNELGATRQFAYDAVGNLVGRTDRNGREIVYSYDALDRRTEERWLDGASVVYTAAYAYDANDRLTNASDAYSAYAHIFDALGRITRIDNAGTPGPHVVMDQAFDAVGNRLSVSATVNGTADFTNLYTYDNLDRQTRVEQTGTLGGNAVDDKRVDFAYNSLGQFTAITRFADLAGTQEVVKTTYSYDAIHRLTTLKHADGPTTRAQYTFTYNAASEITRIVSPDGTVNYTHDSTGQLTGADHATQPDETYTYDANGNRVGGGYVVAPNNRILSDGTYTYEYDAEGNRTRRTEIATGEYESYTWDHRNRLTAVVKHAADDSVLQTASYTYDVFDRRLSKSVDTDGDGPLLAALERFAYDGDQIALAFAGDGSLTNRYLYGPAIDQILADEQHVDGLFSQTLWALTDHLGTVRDVADDSGTILNRLTYSAFGQILSETAPLHHIRFAFTGRDFDPETGLSYHRARYYDPILGRWLSEDPIGFAAGDANLSRYVFNHTTNATDPSGHAGITRLTRNAYHALQDMVRRRGLSSLVRVHHIIPQQFFDSHVTLGPFLKKLDVFKDDRCNLILLPTALGRTKGLRRSLHTGRHIPEYTQEHVQDALNDIFKQFFAQKSTIGEKAALANAQSHIQDLKGYLREGLRDGSIALQKEDLARLKAGSAVGIAGFPMVLPPEANFTNDGIKELNRITAMHYTGDSGIAGTAGLVIDLMNPLAEYKDFCETTQEMLAPVGKAIDGGLSDFQESATHSIRKDIINLARSTGDNSSPVAGQNGATSPVPYPPSRMRAEVNAQWWRSFLGQ